MPDVGVLQLTIQDNSKAAGQGLDFLAGALGRLKTAVDGAGTGLGLSSVSKELNQMAKSVAQAKSTINVLKTIAEFGKSLSAISKIGTFEVNTESFNKLKDAVDGFKIGNAGSQLNQMRLALSGDWGATGADTAAAKIDGIASAAQNLASSNAAVTLKNVAEAIKEFSSANAQLSESGGAHDLYSMMAGMSSQASGIGMNVAKGIEEGIESGKSGAVSASGDVSQEVIDKSKEVLDEHSPSEVFREIGENAMQGMINGMDGKRSDVVTTVTNIMQEAVNSATSNIPFFQALKGDWYYQFPQPSNDEQVEFVPGVNSFNAELMEADEMLHNIETTAEEIQMPDFGDMQTESLDVSEWFDFPDAISESASAFTELATEIDPVTETIAGAGTILKETADEMQTVSSEFTEVATELETAGDMYSALGDSVQQTQNVLSSVSESTQTAGTGMSELNSWMSQSSSVAGTLTGRLKDVDKEMRSKKTDANGAASGFSNFTKRLWEAFPALNAIRQRLKSVLTRQIATKILNGISSGFKEGLENLYHYSNAVNTSFAPAMDSAATSIKQLKNSLGAMIAPVIESLIPVFRSLIDVIITGVNWMNQLFALLRGQNTWTRAVPQTVSAFDKQEKAAKKAGSAIKDLLADWDELNIIQSEGGSGGAGTGTKAAEDYLSMFEEVNKFESKIKDIADFIKNNINDVWKVAKDIGLAILGWKFSNVFSGLLGKLSHLIAVGLIVKLSADVTTLIDEAYVETKNGAFLLADFVVNGALAGIAAKIANAAFGAGAGEIAAGITLAVSAGSTFDAAAKAEEAGQDAEAQMLEYAGKIKGAFAAALSTAGFLATGASLPLAIIGGVATVGLAMVISFSLKYSSRKVQEETEAAKQAFKEKTAGGLDPQKYIEAIQQECDRLTSGSSVVIDTHVEFPNLRQNLENALLSIGAFNALISGNGKLTKEDAASFKENWSTVLDTLDRMNTTSYNTILSGLNDALANAIGKAKDQIAELRTQFIQIEHNVSEKVANLYKEMDEIVGRISEGKYKSDADRQKDIDRYNQLAEAIYVATDTTYNKVKEVMDEGAKLDFSKTGVEGVQSWIEEIGTASSEATDKIEEAYRSVEEAIGWKRQELEGLVLSGDMTREEADAINEMYDDIIKTYQETTENKKRELNEKVNKAYSDMLKSAFDTGMTAAEWRSVLTPILEKLKEAGGELPQWMIEAIQDGMQWSLTEGENGLDPKYFASLFESGVSAQDAVNQIKKRVEQIVKEGHGEDFYLNAIETFGLSGLDVISKYWKEEIVRQALAAGLDSQFINDLMRELGINSDNFEMPDSYKKQMAAEVDETVEDALSDTTIEPNITVEPELTYKFENGETAAQGIEENPAVQQAEETADEIKQIGEASVEAKNNILTLNDIQFDTRGVESSADTAASSIEEMARRIRDAFATLDGLSYEMDINGAKYSGAMSVLIPNVEQKASGGFVRSGDLVLANENGNFEMMGKMGNQPVVANNQQIVAGISQGVSQANSGVESRLGAIETMLTRILQKEFVARAVPSSGWGQHGAQSADAWNKVTG